MLVVGSRPLVVFVVLIWRAATLPQSSLQKSLRDNPVATRTFLIDSRYYWPKTNGQARIPYSIDPEFTQNEQDRILKSISNVNNLNCVLWDKKKDDDQDYVYFEKGTTPGCNSLAGKVGGMQKILLHSSCFEVTLYPPNNVEHEMMHAMGFVHEQQRVDRDCYLWVRPGIENQGSYKVVPQVDTTFPYDFSSIMQYTNPNNIRSKIQGKELQRRRVGFSEMDIAKLKYIYCDAPHYCDDHETECEEINGILAKCQINN